MTLVVRFLTLLTIAAAGFAMPMTCAQGGAAAEPMVIDIPAVQQLETPPVDLTHASDTQSVVHALAEHMRDAVPFDCGKTIPRVNEHPATLDTQPFVPGYLGSTLTLDEDRVETFNAPAALRPIESRAGPPDAPPPKSID